MNDVRAIEDHVDHQAPSAPSLRARWEALREENPRLRIRAAAEQLGVGEAQLLATQLGENVTRLRCDTEEIFEAFPSLGRVMASTRNDWAVIEKTGQYRNVSFNGGVGLVLDEQIDLRLFTRRYHSAFAVEKEHRGGKELLRSVQLFDRTGRSLHKVYIRDEARVPDYEAFVARFRAPEQVAPEQLEPYAPLSTRPDDEVDVASFQQAWLDLEDTHDFFGMLREHEVARTQALRLAPEGHAIRVAPEDAPTMLREAASEQVPIMAFVGSGGCIEIHTGEINRVVPTGDWINVMDPEFNLHLNMSGVAEAWLVRKPTVDGVVTSLELFDEEGGTIVMFFGARKPGKTEDPRWRALIERVTGA